MSSEVFGTPDRPTPLAKGISHLMVGGAVWLAVKEVAGGAAAWVSALLATIAHALFDAPLASWLAGLNFGWAR